MTENSPEAPVDVQDLEVQDNTAETPQDPFGDSETFTVDKDVDASQFEDQVAAALGVESDSLMTSTTTDADGQTVVFIHSETPLDRDAVQKVLDDHVPVPPPAPLVVSPTPVADEEVQALVESLKKDETLTTKELSRVLKSLLA